MISKRYGYGPSAGQPALDCTQRKCARYLTRRCRPHDSRNIVSVRARQTGKPLPGVKDSGARMAIYEAHPSIILQRIYGLNSQ